eukprot:7972007-Pyramimonas_sp.AAC.1
MSAQVLTEVNMAKDGSKNNFVLEGYPTLSRGTFTLWYKVALEEVLVAFESLAKAMAAPGAKAAMVHPKPETLK